MVICAFGDSIVNGVGDPQALGWFGRLIGDARAAGQPITAYNLGVRRNTSAAILERFEEETRRRIFADHPMRLLFAYGAVDAAAESGLSVEDTISNTKAILSRGKALGELLFISPPMASDRQFTEAITIRSQAIAACCQQADIPFLDILPQLKEAELYLEELVGGDGIHPGTAGYSLIFRLVNAWEPWRAWLK